MDPVRFVKGCHNEIWPQKYHYVNFTVDEYKTIGFRQLLHWEYTLRYQEPPPNPFITGADIRAKRIKYIEHSGLLARDCDFPLVFMDDPDDVVVVCCNAAQRYYL